MSEWCIETPCFLIDPFAATRLESAIDVDSITNAVTDAFEGDTSFFSHNAFS